MPVPCHEVLAEVHQRGGPWFRAPLPSSARLLSAKPLPVAASESARQGGCQGTHSAL